MSDARIAVLVRTYSWDDFAFRSCLRIWSRCEGLDFYVLADETSSGPLDVGSFRKLGHTTADFEAAGLPCLAPDNFAPLWWNCDYSLYDAALRLPEYDYYYVVENDVAVNLDLRPMIEQVIGAGCECLVPFGLRPMDSSWAWSNSCRNLPYAKRAWGPISMMLASRQVALYLLSERQKLARKFANNAPADWAFCEGFVGSALLDAGFRTGSAHQFANLSHFGSNSIYLETDPRTRVAGRICHSVLDPDRYWEKFAERGFVSLRRNDDPTELRLAREALVNIRRDRYRDWRVAVAPGNLALDRPARQSSLSRWSLKVRADHPDPNAKDAGGATCGVITGSFGFHTDREDHPWWQVDLERLCSVREVRIFNSPQAPERARRLIVQISTDATHWHEVYRKSDDRIFAGCDDPLSCWLAEPMLARYVRIVLDGVAPLHLSAVEVYGPGARGPSGVAATEASGPQTLRSSG